MDKRLWLDEGADLDSGGPAWCVASTLATPMRFDERMDEYTRDLNLRRDMKLPTGSRQPPPSKSDEEILVQRCLEPMKVLYFRDRPALVRTLKSFEDISNRSVPSGE